MISLKRKLLLRGQAATVRGIEQRVAAVGRTTQAAHSTVAVGDVDVPLVEAVQDARESAEDLPGVADETVSAGDDAWEALETAVEASVEVDKARAEAKEALEKAADAATTADGKNSRRRGKNEPEPPDSGWVIGDQWVVDNDDGDPVELRVWNGTAWAREHLIATDIFVLGSDGVVAIGNGKVTALALAANAIDGMVITAPLIRNAPSGERMQFDSVGLRAFTADEKESARLSAEDGGLLLGGSLTSYEGGNTPRAVLSNGALTFDLPGSYGAASVELSPSGVDARLASQFRVGNRSNEAGSGLTLYGRVVTVAAPIVSDFLPYAVAVGTHPLAPLAVNGVRDITVTLPLGRFTVPPLIIPTGNPRVTAQAYQITTTSFKIQLMNLTTGPSNVSSPGTWFAMQMTPGTADG